MADEAGFMTATGVETNRMYLIHIVVTPLLFVVFDECLTLFITTSCVGHISPQRIIVMETTTPENELTHG